MKITSYICDECGEEMKDPGRTWTRRGMEYHFYDEACKEMFVDRRLREEIEGIQNE